MSDLHSGSDSSGAVGARTEESAHAQSPTLGQRVRRVLVGPPRSLSDHSLFHRVSLVAVLAWVGLGADGLSSSAYGPEEAFRALGEHRALTLVLAVLMATTVFVISGAYSRIIDLFPHGGGGYVVASKLLGARAGVVSGAALLVDYVLTVTVSIAAAGDALFSVLPPEWGAFKFGTEIALLALLTTLNVRGIRESVVALAPVFFLFVLTHAVLIGAGFIGHAAVIGQTAREVGDGLKHDVTTLGGWGAFMLVMHAFSMGGGTYTGIEAVSNGIPMMRHPQAQTAKRTMRYMSVSLAVTATGLLLCYLLWKIEPVAGKTMNAVLVERISGAWPMGGVFAYAAMFSAAALLVVAAQAGFADGPRVLANMAQDSWVPRRFASLSERLTAQNGILLVAGAALAALVYTKGNVAALVVMYSINVFLTFTMSMLAMLVSTNSQRRARRAWRKDALLFGAGFALCATILCVTVRDKFGHGGWLTLVATGLVIAVCALTRRHYAKVSADVARTFAPLERSDALLHATDEDGGAPDHSKPTMVLLVSGYGGLGLHTMLNALRLFPGISRTLSSCPWA